MSRPTAPDVGESATAPCEPGLDVLRGVVRRITFHNPQNRYTVLRLEVEEEPSRLTTAVGYLVSPPGVGEVIRAVGRWRLHPTYGRQFEVHAFHTVTPSTVQGIERFLASGAIKGVGPATARRLVEAFGERTLDVLASDPEAAAARVSGLGLARARSIARQLAEQRERSEALSFLHGLGLGPGLARRLLDRYGLKAVSVVQSSPYRLALEVAGFGFRRADEVAHRFGVAPDDPQRLQAALWHVLCEAVEEGHLFLPCPQLFASARTLLAPGQAPEGPTPDAFSDARLEEALQALAACGRVVREGEAIYPAWLHRCEVELARRLVELTRHRPARRWLPEQLESELDRAQQELGVHLADQQREAVRRALEESLLVVTGGPGTGKTTLVRFIVHLALRAGWKVALAAPTGRAAQRLNEAVFGGTSTPRGGLPLARTIHRLLEPRLREGPTAGASSADGGPSEGRLEFGRNERHPLDADMLIVDEASMLDTVLACQLLRALRPGTRLVLVGDVHQLPSVGPGQVLRDLMEAGIVGVVRLTRIFRQAARSAIVVGAHQVLSGRNIVAPSPRAAARTAPKVSGPSAAAAPGAEPASRGLPDGELRFVEVEDAERCALRIQELVSRELPTRYALDPLRDIQVLAATHRGPAGTEALNELLQAALNPPAPHRPELAVGRRRLRLGDRVMQVRNDYQARVRVAEASGRGTAAAGEGGVFNGEIGRITEVNPHSGLLVVRFEDGREVEYDDERAQQLELAYAVTVHKSQGNEFPCVVMPVVWTMPALMTRHLLYTAITRGKRLVVLVGQRRAVAAYIRHAPVALRHTALARRLVEGLRGASCGSL